MGRRKQAKGARNGATKKPAAVSGSGTTQLSGVGPRYQKYDQFTTKKTIVTDFCVDMSVAVAVWVLGHSMC